MTDDHEAMTPDEAVRLAEQSGDEYIRALGMQLRAAQALAADPGPADPEQEDWDAGERDENGRRTALAGVDDLRAQLAELLFPGPIRPEAVSLLISYDAATSDIDSGPVYHADGRPFDPDELALIQSRTPAEERAAAGLVRSDSAWIDERAAAFTRVMELVRGAPALSRANFHATLRARAVPRDPAGMTSQEYREWFDAHMALMAWVIRVAILPDLPPPLREEAERLLPVLDPTNG